MVNSTERVFQQRAELMQENVGAGAGSSGSCPPEIARLDLDEVVAFYVPQFHPTVDLRVPEVRAAQARLARDHGVTAFCYWHYWFEGHRLLGRPFDEVLRTGEPDFPFCLAWANEPWTRTWLGQGEVLMGQRYSAEDDVAHARWLLPAWADPRWLRVDGRPVFVIYCPNDLPEPQRTTDTLRDQAVRAGLPEPLLLGMNAKDKWRDWLAKQKK